jgi:hypothetical protein
VDEDLEVVRMLREEASFKLRMSAPVHGCECLLMSELSQFGARLIAVRGSLQSV